VRGKHLYAKYCVLEGQYRPEEVYLSLRGRGVNWRERGELEGEG
jgi:hypothetical protein